MNADLASEDSRHLSRALQLATLGLYTTDPNPRVGCVIVNGGQVVGEGWHYRAGEPHAEVLALNAAGTLARGGTAYVTLEPCSHTGRTPPCAGALIEAGVVRVVCCTDDPNPQVAGGGLQRLRAAGLSVQVGLLAEAARALNVGFFSRFQRARPWIRLKLAMTLDGRTAPAAGGQMWLTGEAARADVQAFRARSSAVLTGADTVKIDNPRLDVRLNYGPWIRQPLRVVLDSRLSCAADSAVFANAGVLLFASQSAAAARGTQHASSRQVQFVAPAAGGLDLHAVVAALVQREVNELLVECGSRLAGSFIAAGLVDELVLYIAPRLLGSDAAPLLQLSGAGSLPLDQGFEVRDLQQLGGDVRLLLTTKKR